MSTTWTLDVEQDGKEPEQVQARMRHIVAWERQFPGRSGNELFSDRGRATYLCELAWVALGKPGKFNDFVENTDVSLAPNSGGAPDPTPEDL